MTYTHRHAEDIRRLYEKRLERASGLYTELVEVVWRLDEREKKVARWEGWKDGRMEGGIGEKVDRWINYG